VKVKSVTPTAPTWTPGSVPPTSSWASGEEGVDEVRKLTGGHGVDAVLECVGSMQTLTTSFGRHPAAVFYLGALCPGPLADLGGVRAPRRAAPAGAGCRYDMPQAPVVPVTRH
jgi:hypothetical protein